MIRPLRIAMLACAVSLLLTPLGCVTTSTPDAALSFNRDVRPILAENCFQCHGPDAAQRQAGLRLDEWDPDSEVILRGNPHRSELVRRITARDDDERMPPEDSHKKLSEQERGRLVQWIREGAPYQQHWAFIPPERPAVPSVTQGDWARNPIDRFVLRRLEAEGLAPSPSADRATLLRRASLDLVGLPPTPEQIEAFEQDASDLAYERALHRLFASKRYGEHMALGWLELARYADTDGYQNDRLRYMHVWRDWVIQALNDNMPYDQFVVEQLAGDMLPNATLRQQIASGFNRNHRINSENGSIPDEWRVEYVVDRVDTLGTAFLGLTLSCARCHDHKFDPVSQQEYYQLFAQFNNVPEWGVGPNNGNSPPFIEVPQNWPNLTAKEDRPIPPDPYELNDKQGGVLRPQAGSPSTVMVMQEMPQPRPTFLLQRGQYDNPDEREVLTAAVPGVLMRENESPPTDRLELARWLVQPEHPLTARVTVNRVWQHFFGTGLVKTPDNFGLQGAYPSHPELLDWLATEFIRLDWDIKALKKLIMTSASYRQSSRVTPDLLARDPENRLLARAPRPRLSGQQLRDQALFSSGLLAERIGGPSVKPYMPPGLWKSVSNATYNQGQGDDLYRRSLYTYWRRTTPPPMMTSFNAARREVCAVRNEKTNTPLHALALMNNVVFVESARFLAERMLTKEGGWNRQVEQGFRRVLTRTPTPEDLADLRGIYDAARQHYVAHEAEAEALLARGEKPRDKNFDAVVHASMTMVASAILNLDEATMRN